MTKMKSDEKVCPFCAEIIKAKAIKCKYCKSDLSFNKTSTSKNKDYSSFREAPSQISSDKLYKNSPGRTFGQSIIVCLENYIQFSGRASRSEYWYFFLFTSLCNIFANIIDVSFLDYNFNDSFAPVSTASFLILFLPSMSVLWRRLHDTNKSGWWGGGATLSMITIIWLDSTSIFVGERAIFYFGVLIFGTIALGITIFIFLCTKGDLSKNRFG